MVGTLYPTEARKKDGGFTIFYMGVNLGAAMSPLLCGYVGETIRMALGLWAGDDRHAHRPGRVCRAVRHKPSLDGSSRD